MCDIEPYKATNGSFYSYALANANTKMGCDMTNTLNKLKGGKKKTYTYSNGISNYIRKKLHKTRRSKTHLFRFFLQNKFFKKNSLTKKSYKKGKLSKENYGRPE
jgi:hypothetical protein